MIDVPGEPTTAIRPATARSARPATAVATAVAVMIGGAGIALLCPATAAADQAGFLDYLHSHGYTGRYTDGREIATSSVVALGGMICENLHVDISVARQRPSYPAWPQFPLIAEAAQRELCPDNG